MYGENAAVSVVSPEAILTNASPRFPITIAMSSKISFISACFSGVVNTFLNLRATSPSFSDIVTNEGVKRGI